MRECAVEVVERLGAVAGLEQERPAGRDLAERGAQLRAPRRRRRAAAAPAGARTPTRRRASSGHSGCCSAPRAPARRTATRCEGVTATSSVQAWSHGAKLECPCGSSPASSPRARSTSATTPAASASTRRRRSCGDGASSASSTCTRSPSTTTRPTCASASLDLAALLFATGLDPERSTVFAQSHVTAHAEAAWLLSAVDELRPARPDDAVQGEGRPAGVRHRRASSPTRS